MLVSRRMRAAVMALGALVTIATAPAAFADATDPGIVPNLVGGPAWSGHSPMVGGRSVVSNGEFIYQDYLYDDEGAAVGNAYTVRTDSGVRGGTNMNGLGTYEYPSDATRYGDNAADISQVRARLDGDRVDFMIVLNTLLVPDSTVVGIAIGNATTPGRMTWPLGAGISTPGTQHVITAWGTGAMFDNQPIQSVGGQVAVSTQDNDIQVSVPASLIGTQFRAYVAAGLWDTTKNTWMQVGATRSATAPGGGDGQHPNIFNVAFRQDESTFLLQHPGDSQIWIGSNWWWDAAQSEALANGNIDRYYANIDLTAPDTAPQQYTGYLQRIYYSPDKIEAPNEGITESGVTTWTYNADGSWHINFIGPWQVYDLYVPSSFHRMTVLLHGSGNTTFGAGDPGIERDLGDADGALLVDPLARGVSGGYAAWSESAVLEAMADAQAHYSVDPSLTALGGVSMGGIGVYRILELHPDLFAGGVVWSGCGAEVEGYPCTATSMAPADLFANFRDDQLYLYHGVEDDTIPANSAVQDAAELQALGYPYQMALYPDDAGHTSFYSWDAFPTESAFIKSLPPIDNPVHVTYKTSEGWWRPDISPLLVYDHAYWVSGLRTRDQSLAEHSYGTVDATTQGLGRTDYTTAPITPYTGESKAGSSGSTYVYSGTQEVPGTAAPRQNRFTAKLTNLQAVAFDIGRMGLETTDPLVAQLTTDGASDVTLLGTGPVTVSGAPATQQGEDVVIHLGASGTYTVTVQAGTTAAPGPAAASAGSASTPAAGGPAAASSPLCDVPDSPATECSGSYLKAEDPTGDILGPGGGVVVGLTPDNTSEAGVCDHNGSSAYYYTFAAETNGDNALSQRSSCPLDAPQIDSTSASPDSPNSSMLSGALNPNGEDTKYFFAWDTAANYQAGGTLGNATQTQDAGSGSDYQTDTDVWDYVTGLAADTTYDVQLIATNQSGTTKGSVVKFTTPAS